MRMRLLEEAGVAFRVHSHGRKQYTAEGVAQDLGVPVAQVVKAMIVRRSDRSFILAVVAGDRRLSLKKLGRALGDKDLELASEREVLRVTGFQVGAVSVLGFRRSDIAVHVDREVAGQDRVIISSGRPDTGLEVSPDELLSATGATVGDFAV